MIVQIYEVQNPEEARGLVKLGVDHVGVLVGKGKYPRELSYEKTKEIFNVILPPAKRVALTLSNDFKEICELVEIVQPDILHLGALPESFGPSEIKKLRQRYPDLKIMPAIPVTGEKSIELAKEYEGIVDFLLLDTYIEGEGRIIGATGKVHDWSISKKIIESVKIPAILAGGLGPDNVAKAIKYMKPVGVDSKTKTDKADGKSKDLEKVKEFVKIAKQFIRTSRSAREP